MNFTERRTYVLKIDATKADIEDIKEFLIEIKSSSGKNREKIRKEHIEYQAQYLKKDICIFNLSNFLNNKINIQKSNVHKNIIFNDISDEMLNLVSDKVSHLWTEKINDFFLKRYKIYDKIYDVTFFYYDIFYKKNNTLIYDDEKYHFFTENKFDVEYAPLIHQKMIDNGVEIREA
ncbi:hypothetical protein [Hugenholtzia roseola]|uniref:hypothetical protein n=1 Tax=Hugenholtzia roseola TaxID=1002 RepID=UPI0003F69A12|nr:hypothetical protein [Hugenholtzia roseola]